MTVLGAVLAGGQSRRFGSDKAEALWRGRALIQHAIATICPHVDAILICGRTVPGEVCVSDRPHADLGPLGGLNAALDYGARHGFDRILSVPCDVPSVPEGLIRRLIASNGAACVASLPVIGIWPNALAKALDAHLATDTHRSLRGWSALAGAQMLALEPGEHLSNVNRPADLAALAP